jgi:DNA-binding NtrC family response regulator
MKQKIKILVVDDELSVRESLADLLRSRGFQALALETGEQALAQCASTPWDIVLLDLKLPGMDGLEVLEKIKAHDSETAVLIMTAYASIDSAVSAMKQGAYDYIVKPFDPEEIIHVINKIEESQKLKRENLLLRQKLEEIYAFDILVGKSRTMQEVFETINTVANSDSVVLIRGESGTGKELIARAIHAQSKRRYMPFVAVSLGALPDTLIESELFGYEKGAFTGADHTKKGRFELAHGGTLFLDEIGEISPKTQIDLLRALEEKQFQRVGGTRTISVDVRIISATNRNLEKAVAEGTFREDLYYRLNVVPIHVPPLRERKEDIPLLVKHFLRKAASKTNKKTCRINDKTMDFLIKYHWAGNVRELENVIERMVVLSEAQEITPECLPFSIREYLDQPSIKSLKEWEKVHILRVLEENNWNISKTAQDLEVDRVTLYNKIKKYNLSRP